MSTFTIECEWSTKMDELVHAFFVTACEGGVNYWADVADYRWAIRVNGELIEDLEGFSATLHDNEDDDEPVLVLDRAVMVKGIMAVLNASFPFYDPNGTKTQCETVKNLGSWVHENVVHCFLNPDIADFDADIADQVAQIGLFGEVRYG